jgi:hypothetical protein
MDMDMATAESFNEHVRKLMRLALECEDEERRSDAIRSLSCMALLKDGSPGGPGGGAVPKAGRVTATWIITMLIGVGVFVHHGYQTGDWRAWAAAVVLSAVVAVVQLMHLYNPKG